METWCGMVSCGLGALIYGYQSSIIGVGAILAAYFTIRATRLAARGQVEGMYIATKDQIAANKALLDAELASQKQEAERVRTIRARSVALATWREIHDIRKKAERAQKLLLTVRETRNGEFGPRDTDIEEVRIPVGDLIMRNYENLYFLEPSLAHNIQMMIAFCGQLNAMVDSKGSNAMKSEPLYSLAAEIDGLTHAILPPLGKCTTAIDITPPPAHRARRTARWLTGSRTGAHAWRSPGR